MDEDVEGMSFEIDAAGAADLQLLKASTTRIERDMDRLDRKFDTFLTQHQQKHDVEQAAMAKHLVDANEIQNRGLRHEQEIPQIEKRLEVIETWRHELLGAMGLMRLAFGASILSSIVAIVSLVGLAAGWIH